MKLFTLTDSDSGCVVDGIMISNGVNSPGLIVGEEPAAALVPLGYSLRNSFREIRKAKPGRAHALPDALVVEMPEGPCFLPSPAKENTSECIVHLALCAGERGKLWVEQTRHDEALVEGARGPRVMQVPKQFPGLGVTVLAIGHGPAGEPQALLKLVPGASFRIRRNGVLGGLPRKITVQWTGSKLTAEAVV